MTELKFMGGILAFTPEETRKAARTASEVVIRALGPDASPEAQKDALAGFLESLGLVVSDDPRHAYPASLIGDLRQGTD